MKLLIWLAMITNLSSPALGQARGWVHLASGDSLPILDIGRYSLPRDSVLLALDYQTRISLADTAALRHEVLQIWPSLRKLAEEQHIAAAAIRANHIEQESRDSTTGQLRSSVQAYGFVFQQSPEGKWHFPNDTTTIR